MKSYMYVCLFYEQVNYKDFSNITMLNTADHNTNYQIKVKENAFGKFMIIFIKIY